MTSEHKTKEDPLFGYMADKAMQQMSEVYDEKIERLLAANKHAALAFRCLRGLNRGQQSIVDAALTVLDAATP